MDKQYPVFSSQIPAGQRLTGIGESIHEIGEEHEELHQQCVGGQDQIAHARRYKGEKGGDQRQQEGTDKYVTVDTKIGAEGLDVQDGRTDDISPQSAVELQPHQYAYGKRDYLRQHRPECDSLDLHAKTEYKSCTESNIQQVVENSDHHRGLRVLHPDEKP